MRVLPRSLHAGAWWLWALGVATAASQTTNPLLLGLLITVTGFVVAARRNRQPWGRSFTAFLKLGLAVVAFRVVFQALFTSRVGGETVLFTLPRVTLPEWVAGLQLGGPVTAEAMTLAFYDGLRLATVFVAIGAANALADARRLLRSLPAALNEAGVALVVAMTFTPRLVEDAGRIRRAYALRGQKPRGFKAVKRMSMPLLTGSLESSLNLAAAMDSRGFGRTNLVQPRIRHLAEVLVFVGLCGLLVGLYGLFTRAHSAAGLAGIALGVAAAIAGFMVSSRASRRSRYRPDPWKLPEWLVVITGATCAATFIVSTAISTSGMDLMTVPLILPTLPLLPLVGITVAALPAWITPQPPAITAGGHS